jgi:hypothetical protein
MLALAGIVAIAAAVWAAALAFVGPEGRQGASVGAAIAAGWQMLVLGVLAVALPGNQLIAHGVGMLARLAMVVAAGVVIVPATGLPLAPTLLTMVTVLFATTLIEPVAFSGAGARDKQGR